jgi:hypothetical protein
MAEEPSDIIVTPAMIAAGVEALAFAGSTDAQMMVEIIYRAMVAAADEVPIPISGPPN